MNDIRLGKWLVLLLALPLALAIFGGDRYRYPCQDPANWDKDFCKMPMCEVNRTCPEHIFKGQRDPRVAPTNNQTTVTPVPQQGVGCGK